MKNTLIVALVIGALGVVSISNLNGGVPQDAPSQLANQANQAAPLEDIPQVALQAPQQEPPPPPVTEASPSDVPVPVVQPNQPSIQESVLQSPPVIQQPVVATCGSCCCLPCCCPPRPVPTTFCLVEPCSGCRYEVCVNVPPCCVGQQPIVTWRNGLLGRQIASVCWPCCDKRVKVVITMLGRVRVWG